MSYVPTQSAHRVVQRIIDSIKRNAAERAGRYARARLGCDRLQAGRESRGSGGPVKARQATFRPVTQPPGPRHGAAAVDYFTRLVNSSPKPLVLRSAHHPVALHLLKLANSASYRKYRRLVLLTSPKLIREHCERHGSCSRIYTTSHDNPLLLEPHMRAERVLVCSEKLLCKVSGLHSYEKGVVAEVPYPQPSQHLGNASLVLCVAPSRREAENHAAATLMRTAHALQWQAVWLLRHGEQDFLDPRAMRASQNCLDTMPYVVGSAREALAFAKEHSLLVCLCADGGDAVESETAQQAMKQHRGVLLLVGQQPKELVEAATKLDVTVPNPRALEATAGEERTIKKHYRLDGFVKSCILMYLVRKRLHIKSPRSPYLA